MMFCTVQLESENISGSGVSESDMCVWNAYCLFTVFEVYGDGKVVKISIVL